MKKHVLFIVILLCLLLLPSQILAQEVGIIHQQVEQTNIARDVIYKSITRFTDNGWYKIHVIEGDLNDEYIKLEALSPADGVGVGSTLPQMAQNPDIIAAVNGDLFISGGSYSPIGVFVKNGKMESSPTYRSDELAVFSLDQYNIPIIDYWQWEIKLTAQSREFSISAINKISSNFTYPVVYTPEWGGLSPQTDIQDVVYIVVNNNSVADIIHGPGQDVKIPEKGMVVMARGNTAAQMLQVMEPGCSIDLAINSTPNYAAMKLAIGGGTILVKNGVPYPFSHGVSGNHPRTAIGFSADGSKIIMAAVEGRVPASKGMSQTELAQLMIDLGAYNAMNLDGGGSTTVLARKPGDYKLSLVNTPSDGSIRRIANGISITNTAPAGSLRHILLEVEDDHVFTGYGRTINVKGYDANYNPVDVNPEQIEWDVSGIDGRFDKNVFYPSAVGSAEITARYFGSSANLKLKALDPPVELSTPGTIKTTIDRTIPFVISGKNLTGYSALIENRDLNISAAIGRIENQTYVSGSNEGIGEIRINFNGFEYTVPVSVGYRPTILESFEQISGSFISYPDTVTGSYSLDTRYFYSGNASGRLSYDFTAAYATAASYLAFDGDGIVLDTLPERLGLYIYSPAETSHWIRMMVEDASGKSMNLDLAREINWTGFRFVDTHIPKELKAPVAIKRIYVVETDPIAHDAGEIYFDDLTALYAYDIVPVTDPSQPAVYDPQKLDAPPEEYAFGFTLFGSTARKKLIDILVVNRMKALAAESAQPAVFAGSIGDNTLNDLDIPVIATQPGYSVTTHGNNTFLQLDNHSGGLRSYSPQQWHWFKQQLEDISGGSLFVVLPRPVWGTNGFEDKLEAELFNRYLSDLYEQRNVNVYVLTGGQDALDYNIRDGIKYIGVSGTAVDLASSSGLDDYNYLRFFVAQNGQVNYQVLPMFPVQ